MASPRVNVSWKRAKKEEFSLKKEFVHVTSVPPYITVDEKRLRGSADYKEIILLHLL
jgi:hypothetical protein